MANTFETIGKLSISKATEKFVPYETNSFPSGWGKSRLLFNVQSAQDRHMLTIEGMFKEDGTGKVYTYSKAKVDPVTSVKTKGENIQIPWKDRFKPESIDRVAEFKKFIFDTEEPNRRYNIKNAIKDGKEFEGKSGDELEKLLEESNAKRHEFLTEYDFTEFLHKEIKNYEGKKFKVMGEIVSSEYNGKYYEKKVPQRIYLVDDEEKEVSTGQIVVFYNENSIDLNAYEEEENTGRIIVNGFVRDYDGNRKEVVPCPIQIVIDATKDDEKVKKFGRLMKMQFTVEDDSWKEFGVKVKIVDGAQKVELTEDMLTDFQKEMLELEMTTMEELAREVGGDIYGDKVKEYKVINIARGYTSGRKDSVFTDDDFIIKPKEVEETVEESTEDIDLDDMMDLDMDDIE